MKNLMKALNTPAVGEWLGKTILVLYVALWSWALVSAFMWDLDPACWTPEARGIAVGGFVIFFLVRWIDRMVGKSDVE